MLFRLDFRQTDEGMFLVDAHASGADRRAGDKRSAAVLYASGAVFLELIGTAELDPEAVREMEGAVASAIEQPETPVCCQQVDLSEAQLIQLNLEPAAELYR